MCRKVTKYCAYNLLLCFKEERKQYCVEMYENCNIHDCKIRFIYKWNECVLYFRKYVISLVVQPWLFIYRCEHMQDGINVPALRRGIPDRDTKTKCCWVPVTRHIYTSRQANTKTNNNNTNVSISGFLHMPRFRMYLMINEQRRHSAEQILISWILISPHWHS